jgi:hypothetical protein
MPKMRTTGNWTLEATGSATISANGRTFKSNISNNSATPSYWEKQGGNLSLNDNYNDLHFTLGEITEDTASFHSTWHAYDCVTYYICRVDNGGHITVEVDTNNSGNHGDRKTETLAHALGPQMYRAKRVDLNRHKEVLKIHTQINKGRNRLFQNALNNVIRKDIKKGL